MRIINRHYSHLLEGYGCILKYSAEFAERCAREQNAAGEKHRQRVAAYQKRHAEWLRAKASIDERYEKAHAAWYASEDPSRKQYARNKAAWKARVEQITRRTEARQAAAQAAYKKIRLGFGAAFVIFLLSIFFLPILAFVNSSFYFLLPIILTTPAALGLFLATVDRWTQAKRLAKELEAVRAIEEPGYRPWSPPPVKAAYPPEPARPAPPVPPPNDMVEAWWRMLAKDPPGVKNPQPPKFGDEGETILIEELGGQLSNRFLAVPGAMVERSTDADLIVIGSNGVWVLDSKYYSGSVYYYPMVGWRRGSKNGATQEEEKPWYDLTDEWEREKRSVEYTLQKHMRHDYPPVRGGIAFTHQEVKLHLSNNCPVTAGSEVFWGRRILDRQVEREFSEQTLVECASAILNYSHQLENDRTGSAVELAERLRRTYAEKLAKAFSAPGEAGI